MVLNLTLPYILPYINKIIGNKDSFTILASCRNFQKGEVKYVIMQNLNENFILLEVHKKGSFNQIFLY